MDVNRYLYGGSDALIFAWLMKFDPNYKAIPWLAERYEANPTGDVLHVLFAPRPQMVQR